jgi:hypothetical protein
VQYICIGVGVGGRMRGQYEARLLQSSYREGEIASRSSAEPIVLHHPS